MKKFNEFLIKEDDEYGKQGGMAKSQLRMIMSAAQRLHDSLLEDDALPGHIIADIVLATDYITSAADYMESEQSEDDYEDYELDDMDEEVKYYAIAHEKRTRKPYASTTGHSSPQEAEKAGRAAAKQYGDHIFRYVIPATSRGDADTIAKMKNEDYELDDMDEDFTAESNYENKRKRKEEQERLGDIGYQNKGLVKRTGITVPGGGRWFSGNRKVLGRKLQKAGIYSDQRKTNEDYELNDMDEASLLGPKGAIHKAASADQSDREYIAQRSFKTSWKAKNPGKQWPGYEKAGFKSQYDFKEEVEDLDELSKDTLVSYMKKSMIDRSNTAKTMSDDDYNKMYHARKVGSAYKSPAVDRFNKRTAGTDLAFKKFDQKRRMSEEVELDEAIYDSKYYVTRPGNELTHHKPFETHRQAINHANEEEARTRRVHTVHEIVNGKVNRQWQYSVGHRQFVSYRDNAGKASPKFKDFQGKDFQGK